MIDMINGVTNVLTEAEINDVASTSGAFGLIVGILIGICISFIFIFLIRDSEHRSFKMWLLELSEDKREKIYEHLEDAIESIEELAESNTRLFKKYYNEFCRLRTYLKMKWMQN